MTRIFAVAAALVSAAALAPVAAQAGEAPYYAATPVAAPTKPVLIASGAVWKLNATAYTSPKGTQRDGIVCEGVARSTGKLASFTAGGQAFDDAALTKCNARAK
jgi:hypothetical protein